MPTQEETPELRPLPECAASFGEVAVLCWRVLTKTSSEALRPAVAGNAEVKPGVASLSLPVRKHPLSGRVGAAGFARSAVVGPAPRPHGRLPSALRSDPEVERSRRKAVLRAGRRE
ncbi:hypothetical protein OH76DRAFT_1560934, partial [Lentinus brumalis]